MERRDLLRYVLLASVMVSGVAFPGAAREGEFRRLAYVEHSQGPVDFIKTGSEKPLRFYKVSYMKGGAGTLSFYDWDKKTKQYSLAGQEQVDPMDPLSSYTEKSVVFLNGLNKTFDEEENLPFSFTVYTKQLQVNSWMGKGKQRYNVYVTVRSTNTWDESAVLSVYESNGRASRCVYEDTLIPAGTRLHLQKLVVCDVNKDSYGEILIGIFDGGQETAKIFIYGLNDNPWKSQVIP